MDTYNISFWNQPSGALTLLTGPRGCGKTTECLALFEQARAGGLDVAGLISPAVFEGEQKVGIAVLNLRTGHSRPLAWVNDGASFAGMSTSGWIFDEP